MKSLLLMLLLHSGPIRPEPLAAASAALLHVSLTPMETMLQRRWREHIEDLHTVGQPANFSEIESLRQAVSPLNDGGRVIEELRPSLHEVFRDRQVAGVYEFDRKLAPADVGLGLSKSSLAASRAFLERNAVVAHQLRYLLDMPYGRYVVEHDSNPFLTVFPHFLASRVAAQLLSLEGVTHVAERNVADTLHDVSMLWHLGNTFAEEPLSASLTLRLAAQQRAVMLIEASLRVGRPDDDTLARVMGQLSDQLASVSAKWGLWGDRAFHIEVCDALLWKRVAPESLSPVGDGRGPWWYSVLASEEALVRANQLRGAMMYRRVIDALEDTPRLIRESRELEREIASLPPWQFLTAMNLAGAPRAAALHVRGLALLRCAQAGVAAERHRARTGRFPDRLADLVPTFLPAEPLDPFDGNSLRMKSGPEGVVIYSIGENLIDDSGVVHPVLDERNQSPDAGFRLFWLDRREQDVKR